MEAAATPPTAAAAFLRVEDAVSHKMRAVASQIMAGAVFRVMGAVAFPRAGAAVLGSKESVVGGVMRIFVSLCELNGWLARRWAFILQGAIWVSGGIQDRRTV